MNPPSQVALFPAVPCPSPEAPRAAPRRRQVAAGPVVARRPLWKPGRLYRALERLRRLRRPRVGHDIRFVTVLLDS